VFQRERYFLLIYERERVLVYFVHILFLLFGLDNVFVMRFVEIERDGEREREIDK